MHVEGCDQTARIQWDHSQPFARGGPTSEDNLNPMCGFDNRAKEAGRVVRKGGKWVRVTASGGEKSPP